MGRHAPRPREADRDRRRARARAGGGGAARPDRLRQRRRLPRRRHARARRAARSGRPDRADHGRDARGAARRRPIRRSSSTFGPRANGTRSRSTAASTSRWAGSRSGSTSCRRAGAIVVHCSSGYRSSTAASILVAQRLRPASPISSAASAVRSLCRQVDQLEQRVPVPRRARDAEPALEVVERQLRPARAVRVVQVDLAAGDAELVAGRAIRSRGRDTRPASAPGRGTTTCSREGSASGRGTGCAAAMRSSSDGGAQQDLDRQAEPLPRSPASSSSTTWSRSPRLPQHDVPALDVGDDVLVAQLVEQRPQLAHRQLAVAADVDPAQERGVGVRRSRRYLARWRRGAADRRGISSGRRDCAARRRAVASSLCTPRSGRVERSRAGQVRERRPEPEAAPTACGRRAARAQLEQRQQVRGRAERIGERRAAARAAERRRSCRRPRRSRASRSARAVPQGREPFEGTVVVNRAEPQDHGLGRGGRRLPTRSGGGMPAAPAGRDRAADRQCVICRKSGCIVVFLLSPVTCVRMITGYVTCESKFKRLGIADDWKPSSFEIS